MVIQYYASAIILNIHSDASYISAGKGRSCTGGYFSLGSTPTDGKPFWLNDNANIMCNIPKLVAALAELGALPLNTREAKALCLILHKLGHLQPSTPIYINNTTAVGIINNTIKYQRSQAFEMQYFCLLDQAVQK